jgi:hypothetical protein
LASALYRFFCGGPYTIISEPLKVTQWQFNQN